MKEMDFKRKFDELPEFNPDSSIEGGGTPLPMSPWDVISGCRMRRMMSAAATTGGESPNFYYNPIYSAKGI